MSDLERWVWFAEVAEDMSFSRAARRLKVDQPWLSRQIQQLETQTGFELFVRSPRGVALTREGEALLEDARALAEAARSVREEMRVLTRDAAETVAFGYNAHAFWMPALRALTARFRADHGEASLNLTTNYTPRLLKKLRHFDIDFALVPLPAPLQGLESLVVHRTRAVLLAPPGDPLAGRGPIELADVAGRCIVSTAPKLNPGFYELTYGPFVKAGATVVIPPEGQAALAFHARAEGCLMVSAAWPHDPTEAPEEFTPVEIASPLPAVEHAVVRRPGEATPLAQAFWELVEALALPEPA